MELVRRKLVASRTDAQRAISEGRVRVASNPQPKPSTMVASDEPVHIVAAPETYVSRGGHKLAGALDAFGIDVSGTRAVDVGASTGGFTDCLLQRGASSVVAIDVGYGQMHWRVRQDPRVEVVERTNIRTADPTQFGPAFDIVVADVSFISLKAIVGPIEHLGGVKASWVLLIKPQFEAGRSDVGKGGIVRDQAVRERTVLEVASEYATHGLHLHGLIVSPIVGTNGNIEYVAWFRRDDGVVAVEDQLAAIRDGT